MTTIGSETTARMTAELQHKMPIAQKQHYDLVLENDLAGRAALAVLWARRTQLTVHIMAQNPTARHITALKSGLQTVRNAPEVFVLTPHDASQLAASSDHLIWALDAERTSERVHNALERRIPAQTFTPLQTGFDALDGSRLDQTQPAHELILREVIQDHARFLNFFGDRFNAQDLYERSKYPVWFTPDCETAVPQLFCYLFNSDGAELTRRPFSGKLQLEPLEIQAGNWIQVDFQPVGNVLDTAADLALSIASTSRTHEGIQLRVCRDQKLVRTLDIATDDIQSDIALANVRPGTSLSVAVIADLGLLEPLEACTIDIRLKVHPPGTHPVPPVFSRFKAWLTGFLIRSQRRKS